MESRPFRTEINGSPATADDLRVVATVNYGHFTSLQVRAGRAQGFGLHLARLDAATRRLFGAPLDPGTVRRCVRHALGDDARPASVRINVFARALTIGDLGADVLPDVLVTVGPGREAPTTPLAVRSVVHERATPELKHVGTFENLVALRDARRAGFDDALFVDAHGGVIEGSTWNLGAYDGNGVVFAEAPMLVGTGLQLLERALPAQGIEVTRRRVLLAELPRFRAVFATNALAAFRPLCRVDGQDLPQDAAFAQRLRALVAGIEWEPI